MRIKFREFVKNFLRYWNRLIFKSAVLPRLKKHSKLKLLFSVVFLVACQAPQKKKHPEGQGQWQAQAYLKTVSPARSSYLRVVFQYLQPEKFLLNVSSLSLGVPVAEVVRSGNRLMMTLPTEKKQFFNKGSQVSLKKVVGFDLSTDLVTDLFLQRTPSSRFWRCRSLGKSGHKECSHRQKSMTIKWSRENQKSRVQIKSDQFFLSLLVTRVPLGRKLTAKDFKIKRRKNFRLYRF